MARDGEAGASGLVTWMRCARRATRRQRIRSLGAGVLVLSGLVSAASPALAASAAARTPTQRAALLSRAALPASDAWRSYVEGNGASVVTPIAVKASGDVSDPQALVSGSGTTRLTYVNGDAAPVVILDYGREVGGLPFFGITSVNPDSSGTPSSSATPGSQGNTVTMRAGYSEVEQYLFGTQGYGPPPSSDTLTGDANGNNGVGTDANRYDDFALSPAAAGTTVQNPVTAVQGGERYEAITLTTPGTVVLSRAGIAVKFNNAGAGSYRGYFLSSDQTLNRIWYDGVYTAQTDDVPVGGVCASTSACSRIPVILDGAKRDRRPWSGDLSVEGRTLFDSLGFGPAGSDYIKYSLLAFGSAPQSDGSICGQISDWTPLPAKPASCSFYSPTYSMYFPINLAEYYLYSGDTAFAESQYQAMRSELAYNQSSIDSASGLSTASGSDWDFYDGNKGGNATQGGAVTATNMLDYEALTQAAWLAGQLAAHDPTNAAAASWRTDAAAWQRQAAALKAAINAQLFNTSKGVYQLSSSDNYGTNPSPFQLLTPTPSPIHPGAAVPQDANAQAIVFGVAPGERTAGILRYLKDNLWGTYGPQPYSSDAGYSTVISPFVSGFELEARLAAGDTAGALALTKLMWAQMVDPAGRFYTGTLWEKFGQNGQITDSNASLAHGWATEPVSAFSSYLLGVQPAAPGYRSWTIAPQPGGLAWAQGQVPTPAGPIVSRWRGGGNGSSFILRISAPAGTSGTVSLPELGAAAAVARNGVVVWSGGRARGGAHAVVQAGRIVFWGVRGAATFAEVLPAGAPGMSRCPAAAGSLSGRSLGPLTLGMSRAAARLALPRRVRRSRGEMDVFCARPDGIRAGYASARLLRGLPPLARRRLLGRIVLLLSSAPRYRLRGVSVGTRLVHVARHLRAERGFRLGANTWYVVPNGAASGILKVRHGIIEEIGIADSRLTRTRRDQLRLLTSFS